MIIDHFTVKFRRHQHFIKLSVLIFSRKNVNLINTVGETDFPEHAVDFPFMAERCFDFCDHVFAQRMIYKTILLLEFRLIFRFKIFSALFQHFIIHIILMFYTCKTICRIYFVKPISCRHTFICFKRNGFSQFFQFFLLLSPVRIFLFCS